MASHLEIYQRTDHRWAWRLRAGNGQIIATDGGQGYESRAGCADIAQRIISGEFVDDTSAERGEAQP